MVLREQSNLQWPPHTTFESTGTADVSPSLIHLLQCMLSSRTKKCDNVKRLPLGMAMDLKPIGYPQKIPNMGRVKTR